MITTSNLSKKYSGNLVLDIESLEIPKGQSFGLVGNNGAGKTTTLRSMCQTVKTSGEVVFLGDRISGLATDKIVRMGMAHVPDGRGTFTDLTVEENLRLGAYSRKDKDAVSEDIEGVFEHFPRLKERLYQQAGTLSGGEQQMLAISRALMLRPKLLLLDEPSFGLAPLIVQEIFEIMRNINKTNGVSMLLVEQNASLALNLADHAYLLETGNVVLSGPAEDIRSDESVRRTYLGY